MMNPGPQSAPLPPLPPGMDPSQLGGAPDPSQMGAPPMGAPMAPPSPVDAVMAALQGMQMQRQSEDDAVLAAVMKATGAGLPPGIQGATEGAPFSSPNPDAVGDGGAGPAPSGMGY